MASDGRQQRIRDVLACIIGTGDVRDDRQIVERHGNFTTWLTGSVTRTQQHERASD
jgi:hypothetical protein